MKSSHIKTPTAFSRRINKGTRLLLETILKPFWKHVKNGPFEGLHYTPRRSVGSQYLPKLIGTYESELNPVWNLLKAHRITRIFDIGCADGFYAVGLLKLFPEARIHAFDLDPDARKFTQIMADKNHVSDRLNIHGEFVFSEWQDQIDEGTLILSDCEGFEKDIFSHTNIQAARKAICVVEIHESKRSGVTDSLLSAFSTSGHQLRWIKNLAPAEKLDSLRKHFPSIMPSQAITFLADEQRHSATPWLIAYPESWNDAMVGGAITARRQEVEAHEG
jgi:SAM-dependent methyltransferase